MKTQKKDKQIHITYQIIGGLAILDSDELERLWSELQRLGVAAKITRRKTRRKSLRG